MSKDTVIKSAEELIKERRMKLEFTLMKLIWRRREPVPAHDEMNRTVVVSPKKLAGSLIKLIERLEDRASRKTWKELQHQRRMVRKYRKEQAKKNRKQKKGKK